MANKSKKAASNRFALRWMPSVRMGAEQLSKQDGVSLNQFINVAIAEKVAQMENQAWIARRKPLTDQDRERMMALLDQCGTLPPDPVIGSSL